MLAIAALVFIANTAVSRLSAPLALAAPAYGVMLAVLERHSARLRDNQLLNLAVTYPVQVIAGLYVYLSLADSGTIAAGWRVVPLLLVFAGVFLQFELARKTGWHADPGERLYSGTELGPTGSGLATVALAAIASVTALALLRPWQLTGTTAAAGWLPGVALSLPAVGAWQFFARRRPAWPVLPAMGFIVIFFLGLIARALTTGKGA
jgi:hypothetical protein